MSDRILHSYSEIDAQVFFQELVIFIFQVIAMSSFATGGWFIFIFGAHFSCTNYHKHYLECVELAVSDGLVVTNVKLGDQTLWLASAHIIDSSIVDDNTNMISYVAINLFNKVQVSKV